MREGGLGSGITGFSPKSLLFWSVSCTALTVSEPRRLSAISLTVLSRCHTAVQSTGARRTALDSTTVTVTEVEIRPTHSLRRDTNRLLLLSAGWPPVIVHRFSPEFPLVRGTDARQHRVVNCRRQISFARRSNARTRCWPFTATADTTCDLPIRPRTQYIRSSQPTRLAPTLTRRSRCRSPLHTSATRQGLNADAAGSSNAKTNKLCSKKKHHCRNQPTRPSALTREPCDTAPSY